MVFAQSRQTVFKFTQTVYKRENSNCWNGSLRSVVGNERLLIYFHHNIEVIKTFSMTHWNLRGPG